MAAEGGENNHPVWRAIGGVFAVLAAALVLLAIVGVIGLVAYRIYPGTLPTEKNPSFLTELFDSGIVLFAARVAALALAFFIVASVIQRTRAGQYLNEAFGMKTGPTAEKQAALAESLETSDEVLERLRRERREGRKEIARLREENARLRKRG